MSILLSPSAIVRNDEESSSIVNKTVNNNSVNSFVDTSKSHVHQYIDLQKIIIFRKR